MYQDVTSETDYKILKLTETSIKCNNSSYILAQALLIANHSSQKLGILLHNIF